MDTICYRCLEKQVLRGGGEKREAWDLGIDNAGVGQREVVELLGDMMSSYPTVIALLVPRSHHPTHGETGMLLEAPLRPSELLPEHLEKMLHGSSSSELAGVVVLFPAL